MGATAAPEDPPADGAAGALVVLVTIPAGEADSLARSLVEEGRAACVNRIPGVRSTYSWEGRVEVGEEVLLVCKTTVAGYASLESRVRELHPYAVPEVLALAVAAGFGPYLDWLRRSVTVE